MAYGYDEFDHAYEYEGNGSIKLLVTGLVVGGLIGAAAMLFLAPDSGKKTIAKLRKKTMKLADHTKETVDDTVKQARDRFGKATAGVRKQASKVQHRGHDLLEEQKERVADMVETGRKKIHMPGR